jgi:hypothetical protein
VLELPTDATAADVKRLGIEDSAMLVSLTIESVAIMVHRGIVDIDMVWELMGGVVLGTWDRLRDWADAHRASSGREKFNEWFQWPSERLAESYKGDRGAPERKPVVSSRVRWMPRSGNPPWA